MKRKIVSALVAAAVSVSLGVSGIPAAASGNVPGGAETFAWKAETADSEADENTKSAAQPGELPDTQNTGEVQPTEVPSDSETSQTETSGTGESPELSDTNEPDPDDSGDSDVSQPTVTPGGAAEETETETPVQPEEGNFLPDNSVPEEQPAEVETAPADQAQIPQVMALYRQWQQENGVWYYYNADGERATGWLEDGGNLYYLNPDGSMATGWQQIDGKWYYFRSWGAAYRNEIFTDPSDGNIYYGLSDGSMAKSSWIQIDGKWYYFRSWGAAYRNEIFTDPADGNIYYGLSDGSMAKSSWIQIGGKWYYFRSWGAAYRNEIFTDPSDGNIYYGLSDGSMAKSTWIQTGGKWYYFRSWGAAYRNEIFTDPADGNIYYGLSDGSMAKSTWIQIGGKWYYFRSWGAAYRNEIFTDPADGNIYYGQSDGSMAKNTWITKGGKKYYFRSWGAAYHNEIFTDPANGNIYYGSSDGSVVVNQWVQTSGGRYRFDSQGRAYRNQWFDSAGNPTSYEPAIGFYYVGSNGVMLTDTYYKTQKDGGDYYYSFSGTGACNYADPQYVRAKDSVNGIYYVMEHQYFTDPQVSERDLMAAICAAEAGIQRTTGMTAVAMVVRNRMEEYGYSMKTAIYRQQQFEPARNGSLTRYLQGISSGTSSIMQELVNTGAYIAADTSEKIMNDYKTNGTNRVIPGFGDTRADFDYLYFMTPAAFERLNLDPEKCVTYTYTYQGATYTSSHIFFVNWVRKS